MKVSEDSNDRDFYAVRPDLVLRAADVFRISSSMLDRGAKRLHSRAVAIKAEKEAGQWGRHQRPVITQYCDYTKTTGSDFLLPWQELVEHQSRYDGKEGISTRTGNRPLSTVVRLLVDADALKRARKMNATSIEALSDACGFPAMLLVAIESGDWPDVAESTADRIAEILGLPIDKLFLPLETHIPAIDDSNQMPTSKHRDRMLVAQGALIALVIGGGLLIWRSLVEPTDVVLEPGVEVGPEETEIVNELGGNAHVPDEPVETVMINAPLVPVLVGCWQWSNGMRIVVTNNKIANNGVGTGPWKITGEHQFGIEWPDWTAKVTLSSDGQNLRSIDMFRIETTATRMQGEPDGFVGMWQWDNGGIVNIAPEGQMTLVFFNGHWSKQYAAPPVANE